MEFNQVVRSRRSIFKFESKSVDLNAILPLLDMAVMAPNHHLTEPWQFIWLGHETRRLLAEYYALARANKKCSLNSPDFMTHKLAALDRFMAIPAILMVACKVDDDVLLAEEDYAATCCAVQNLLLAATNNGLGSQWSTHPMIRDKAVLELLGLDHRSMRLVAMVYLGYPKVFPPASPRKPAREFLTVLG